MILTIEIIKFIGFLQILAYILFILKNSWILKLYFHVLFNEMVNLY